MSVTVQLRIISRYVCGGINTDRIGAHVYRRRITMRLIDADAFGNRLYHEVFEKDSEDQRWDSGCWMRYRLFEKVLKEQPTIEQPEIIRCRDCRYWQDNNGGYPHDECRWNKDETPNEDDYCSYAERREVSK